MEKTEPESIGTAHQPLSEKTVAHEDHSTVNSTEFKDNDSSVVQGDQSPAPQSPPITPPPPSTTPPNGGLKAWLQVAGSFRIFLNTWGIVNTYGVFQTYYTTALPETSSTISWIGSIQTFLLCVIGTVVGPIYDRGYCRTPLAIGWFLTTFGVFTTSICKTYRQLVLAQGVVTGFGFGRLFLPGVTIVSQYFSIKKSFATGVASLGSSIGGVIYSILWTQLEPKIGFVWATRVIAFILMTTLLVPLVVMRPMSYASKPRSLFDKSSFTDLPYILFGFGIFFGYMGIYVVMFYIELYAMGRAHMTFSLAFYLLALVNAGSSFGRILPNFAADYVGPLNMQTVFSACAAILSLPLVAIRNVPGILSFCVLYGFFTGTFVSLPAPTTASLPKDMSTLGGRMSMAFMAAGIGSLVGSPIAGAILATDGGNNWNMLQVWSGGLLVLSTLSMFAAKVAKIGFNLTGKA